MAVEKTSASTVITGDHIYVAQWSAQVSRLALQISLQEAGIRPTPGLVSALARRCGSARRTGKGVLEDLVLYGYAEGMQLRAVWNTVTRALGDDRAGKLRGKCERMEARREAAARMKGKK